MSVDSLETGISGSSIEMKSQTGPPDMERLQSIIEKQVESDRHKISPIVFSNICFQKREIKDLSEMLKEAGETFSLKETQLSKLEEELKISEEYSMQQVIFSGYPSYIQIFCQNIHSQVKVMQESQTALDEIRAQLEKALEKMQTKDATICELEQQVANLTNAKGKFLN